MSDLKELTREAESILIAGHRRPDGDCTGACIAAYRYLHAAFPQKQIDVFLENMPENYMFMDEGKEIVSHGLKDQDYDLMIALDSSTVDCLGEAQKAFERAGRTLCIDHHISNLGYAKENVVDAKASSTCEVLYGLFEEEKIDFKIAEALYVGIMFDTGVFRHPNTSRKTMEIAGKLIEKGIPFSKYIDICFVERTYIQAQLLGRTLLASMRVMDGKCIVASISRRTMEFYGAKPEDVEGIIEQLRVTRGVEVAILLQEIGEQMFKVSMRSNEYVDVSKVAVFFNGGGHIRAAGCTMSGSMHDVVNNLTEHIELQVKQMEEGQQ